MLVRLVAMLLAASVGIESGCAQRTYRVATLPAEYAAPPAAELDTVDLARWAGAAAASDVIAWGDLLCVEIDAGLPTLEPRSTTVRVAKDGTAGIPLVGRVSVAGLEVEQAEQVIGEAARQRNVFPNPYVSLRIEEARTNRVTVVGAVEKPGVYELPRGSNSLLAALVAAEGLSEEACGDVEIRHTDPRLAAPGVLRANSPDTRAPGGPALASHEAPVTADVIQVNLLAAADPSAGQHILQDGDVVDVRKRDLPPVHVIGLVNKPGPVEMTANREIRLLDALAVCGGCSSQVADKVAVIRRPPGVQSPVTITTSIKKAIEGEENLLLAPGDTVVVRQTPETVVVDVLKSFIRFGISGSVPMF